MEKLSGFGAVGRLSRSRDLSMGMANWRRFADRRVFSEPVGFKQEKSAPFPCAWARNPLFFRRRHSGLYRMDQLPDR